MYWISQSDRTNWHSTICHGQIRGQLFATFTASDVTWFGFKGAAQSVEKVRCCQNPVSGLMQLEMMMCLLNVIKYHIHNHFTFIIQLALPANNWTILLEQSFTSCVPLADGIWFREKVLELSVSYTVCTRLAGNTGCKKSPFWHHRATFVGPYLRN